MEKYMWKFCSLERGESLLKFEIKVRNHQEKTLVYLSTDEQIKKMWCLYTMEYYSAIEKNETMPFAAMWMGLEIIILNGVSQKEKDKCHVISLIYGV